MIPERIRDDTGVSIAELLVVLVMVSLVTGLAFSSLRHSKKSALDEFAANMKNVLQSARLRAISQQKPVVLEIDLERRQVVDALGNSSLKFPNNVSLHLISAESKYFRSGQITFFPDRTSTGGRLDMQNDGEAVTLSINWLTGAITVQSKLENDDS